MKIKLIKLSGAASDKKIEVVCKLCFPPISPIELKTLCSLIKQSVGNNIGLSPDISKMIQLDAGISQSSFSTAIFRLAEKKILKKQGKTILLNPVFNELLEAEEVRIKFIE